MHDGDARVGKAFNLDKKHNIDMKFHEKWKPDGPLQVYAGKVGSRTS